MSIKVVKSAGTNTVQSQDSTVIIDNSRPVTVNDTISITSFDSSKKIDLPNIEDTELYREEIEVEIEEKLPTPSIPRQPRYPSINITVDGQVKQTENKTITNITQLVNNSYITQKTEPYLNKIGGLDKQVQYNVDNEFDGSKNFEWIYEDPELKIAAGNLQVSNTIFSTDIANYKSNVVEIDTGFNWYFTANGLIFPEYILPNSSGSYGQIFVTNGVGNTYWTSPESSYQTTIVLTNAEGIVTHDCSLGPVFIHNNIAGDIIPNLTNLFLFASKSTNIILKLNQGATAYDIIGLRIDGAPQTILWMNNDFPFGNPLKTDMVSFTIINISSTYLVFGQMMTFD